MAVSEAMPVPAFALPAGAAPVACVDVGGTKVAVCVADEHGLRGRFTEPTAKEGNPDALGLQLVPLLIEQLHGTLEINREMGTRFCVTFPNSVVEKEAS